MPIDIHYTEEANSMEGCLIVTDPNDSNKKQEFYIPKFIYDLIKSQIDDGTSPMQTCWDRSLDVTKSLPT